MKIIHISKSVPTTISPAINNEIHLFTQFFVHSNNSRNCEIIECLHNNFYNVAISKIYLLNERIYTSQEMGFIKETDITQKIIQINIHRRLRFQDIFEYTRIKMIKGYIVLVNSDIFFDDSIKNLRKSKLHEEKQMIALLRYEYIPRSQIKPKLFGPRFDSQDTWIFHSNTIIKANQEKVFNFEFGKPGCDNKIIYLLKILGYEIFNDPSFLKTFHNHSTQIRNYSNLDVIKEPWGVIVPASIDPLTIKKSLGIDLIDILHVRKQDIWFEDNDILRNYIYAKISDNIPFIIPRISGIENNFAVFAKVINQENCREISNYFEQVKGAMKNNAGIKLSNFSSIKKYSDLYLEAFDKCEIYSGWEVQGKYLNHISSSHEYMKNAYSGKKMIWSYALDVFHYIHSKPWTQSLQGKRVLIISPFTKSIEAQLTKREKIYDGVDLFPDCTFILLTPPQTQADMPSLEFDEELLNFYHKLDKIKNDYDIALLSCGGYANPILNHIYTKHRKSGMYIGGTLQMFFGIYGNRWLLERSDILRLYINNHWVRPLISERPLGFEKVENSCYW